MSVPLILRPLMPGCYEELYFINVRFSSISVQELLRSGELEAELDVRMRSLIGIKALLVEAPAVMATGG